MTNYTSNLSRNLLKLAQVSGTGVLQKPISPVLHRCIIPGGFPYEAYNGKAMLHPRGILMLLERARLTSWYSEPRPFMDMPKLDTLIYMVTASLDIDQKVYDETFDKQPITVDHELAYLGNTSFKLKYNIMFPDNPEHPLITGEQMCVLVDPKTKRPSAPPQSWSGKYKDSVDKSGRSFKFASAVMPSDIEVSEAVVTVNPSDLDFYLHAGSANYVKFITDAYQHWHVQKFGFDGNGDAFRKVKNMTQSFKGEASLGDKLNVRFWSNKDNQDLFHFHVFKNENVIHECHMEFYPQMEHSSTTGSKL